MKKFIFSLVVLFAFAGQDLLAQYNSVAKQNRVYETKEVERVNDDGDIEIIEVKEEVAGDQYGNAAGNQYDLAEDGAFEGNTVAILHLYTGEGFDFSLPEAALKEKGFSVFRWLNAAPPATELREKLENACQLWVISNSNRLLNDEHLAVIKDFFDSGKGLYIWGDNQPYYSDANFLAENILGTTMNGNTTGDHTVGILGDQGSDSGITDGHLISTGIANIYEGITIATITPNQDLEPLIYGSAGNLVAAVYEKEEKRAIIDGGFTRLYYKWDTAGTGRYVKNAAAWLANFERFGEMVYKKEDFERE
ncbi:MAG: hypothetical protein AAF487_13175 [Bacteroidota bacterium]